MENVEINREEVLRYLGHRNQKLDDKLVETVEECVEEIKRIASPKYTFKTFFITSREPEINLENGLFELPGKAISRHLTGSCECILMAATLGFEVDKKIRYYEKIDLAKAMVLDACATAYIEEVCDRLCKDIEKDGSAQGKSLTGRFSPGYGDLPIQIQKGFLNVLDAGKRIGLAASSANILMPRKSVTAVVGIVDGTCGKAQSGCSVCSKRNECAYKRRSD
jgi:hypothetical protein